MNNTINTYNSPTFCAKPNVKQARRAVDVKIHTLKDGDSVLFSTVEHDLRRNVKKITDEYRLKGKLCKRQETVETPSKKTVTCDDFNERGKHISHVKIVYQSLLGRKKPSEVKGRMVENWCISDK